MIALKGLRLFVIIFLFHLAFTIVFTNAEQPSKVYIYDFSGLRLEKIKNYFSKLPELEVTVYYLDMAYCLNEFLEIVNLLVMGRVEILPPDFCIPCAMTRGSWQEIYVTYASPLLLFFRNGKLTAIVISRHDESILNQAYKSRGDIVKIFLYDGSTSSLDENARTQIEQLFKGRMKTRINIPQVLPLIVAAAVTDAINPCEFFVFLVFLSLVVFRLGRKAVLKFGLAYSIAIFIAYFMMGLGIWRSLGYIHEAKIFVVILGFSLGLRSILNFAFGFFGLLAGLRESISGFMNRKFKRVPKAFSERLAERLRKFSDNPFSAFAIGVTVSVFLLPCTSGPYLIALSLIANLETQIQGIVLLLIYNSIIITPFLAITAGVCLLKLKTSELKRWSSIKQRWLNLAEGLLMIALAIYLIIYTL